jgi:filamentous hemagglutinin family protein
MSSFSSIVRVPRQTRISFAISTLLAPALALSAPAGGVVTSGTAAISQSGAVTNINQSTQKAAINWQGFSISASETVNFNQPNSSAITLNRVVGNERSVIEGALNANGKVFLINSNGMLFAKGSSVNTGGFVGSTLNLTDEDFNAGKYVFKSNGSAGAIINLGTITAKDGGYVALLGNNVSNQGVIVATKGTVALSAGDKITLNFNGDSLLSVSIDEGTLNALVENKQAIYADGGTVYLTAKAADELLGAQVNNTGIVQARTIDDLKGKIELYAHGGTANVDGTLDASAPNGGDGGFIETSGDKVSIADSALVTTKAASGKSGTWLIDPTNFTISIGSAAKTDSGIGASTLANSLNNGSVVIATAAGGSQEGDINVNAAVSWTGNTKLTLTAADDINVNAAITASNGSLELNAGSAAGNDININAPITLGGTHSSLVMNYGGDYNIRTKASYSGTTTDAKGNLVAKKDTSGGVYGSVNFTACQDAASCANTQLVINGASYTLIGGMSQLDALDKNDATTGYWYNPVTGNYDVSVSSKASTIALTSTISDVVYYYNPVSGAYDIPRTAVNGGATYYYNLETGLYDRSTVYPTSGGVTKYWYDPATGKYDIPNALSDSGSVKYYNGKTGQYDQASSTAAFSNYYYNPANGLYDLSAIYGLSGNFAVAHDLDAFGVAYVGSVINNLNGAFVGLGHSISGLKINSTLQNTALFSQTTSGSIIRDLGLLSVDITSTQNNTASLVAINLADIGNVYATGKVSGTSSVAGLVATSGTASTPFQTLYNSFADVDVTASNGSGAGLVGMAYSLKIVNSHSSGDVKADNKNSSNVGGLVGSASKGFILNSYSSGDVYGGAKTGGLVGLYNTIVDGDNFIENSFSTGSVFGTYNIGGLVGHIGNVVSSDGGFSIRDSYATGNVTPADVASQNNETTGMGGLVGYAITTGSGKVIIIDSYATGSINATNIANVAYLSVGGLVGALVNDFSIENSYATGDITGPYNAGGLVGQTSSSKNYPSQTISKSYATGDVSGNTAGGLVGGVIGSSTSIITIKDSYATGDVTGTGNLQVGGLIGLLSGKTSSIIGSYATGNVTGGNSEYGVGGLVGRNEGSISNSYATGLVSGNYTAKVGGLVGYGGTKSVITNSYYNSDLNPKGVGSGKGVSTGLSGDQVADAKYYANGTIGQVLAARAAEAARQQAFRDAGTQVATNEVAQALKPSLPAPEQIRSDTFRSPAAILDQNIVFADARNFSADIHRIEIDGKTFILDEDDGKGKSPAVPAR